MAKLSESSVGLGRHEIFGDHRFRRFLVDGLRIGWIEFLFSRIFLIAEPENDLPGFAGLQGELDVMRAGRSPAVSHGICGLALPDDGGWFATPLGSKQSVG